MPGHEASVVIHRPVEDVFEYMDDISHEHEWQPRLAEWEQIPSGPAAVGTRRRYVSEFMGRRVENTYVIRTYEPNRRLLLETTEDSSISTTTEIRWKPVPGGTQVTMSVDGRAKGALRLVPLRVLEAAFNRDVNSALARLKETLEA